MVGGIVELFLVDSFEHQRIRSLETPCCLIRQPQQHYGHTSLTGSMTRNSLYSLLRLVQDFRSIKWCPQIVLDTAQNVEFALVLQLSLIPDPLRPAGVQPDPTSDPKRQPVCPGFDCA